MQRAKTIYSTHADSDDSPTPTYSLISAMRHQPNDGVKGSDLGRDFPNGLPARMECGSDSRFRYRELFLQPIIGYGAQGLLDPETWKNSQKLVLQYTRRWLTPEAHLIHFGLTAYEHLSWWTSEIVEMHLARFNASFNRTPVRYLAAKTNLPPTAPNLYFLVFAGASQNVRPKIEIIDDSLLMRSSNAISSSLWVSSPCIESCNTPNPKVQIPRAFGEAVVQGLTSWLESLHAVAEIKSYCAAPCATLGGRVKVDLHFQDPNWREETFYLQPLQIGPCGIQTVLRTVHGYASASNSTSQI